MNTDQGIEKNDMDVEETVFVGVLKTSKIQIRLLIILSLIVSFCSILPISLCKEAQLPQHRPDQHQELWQNHPNKGLFYRGFTICDNTNY